MTKRSKNEDGDGELSSGSEQALIVENLLQAAVTIVDAAEARKRVASTGARKYEPSQRDRLLVIWKLWAGFSQNSIASDLGMHIDTFRNHFAVECELATKGLVTDITKTLVAKAIQGDLTAMQTVLRRWGGDEWREAVSPSKGASVAVNVTPQIEGKVQHDPDQVARVIDAVAERVAERLPKRENTD